MSVCVKRPPAVVAVKKRTFLWKSLWVGRVCGRINGTPRFGGNPRDTTNNVPGLTASHRPGWPSLTKPGSEMSNILHLGLFRRGTCMSVNVLPGHTDVFFGIVTPKHQQFLSYKKETESRTTLFFYFKVCPAWVEPPLKTSCYTLFQVHVSFDLPADNSIVWIWQ